MVQQVSVTILVVLSAANADVSHLNGQNGYHYSNLGLTSGLKLHTSGEPAPTQYRATYGDALPNSYVPPPSGSPFNSVAPLPQVHTPSPPSTRLSVPLQSPLLAGQKFGQTQFQTQPNFQQPRTYQTPTYQNAQTYQAPKYQTPAYQSTNYQSANYQPQTYQPQTYQAPALQSTFQTQGFSTNTFNNGLAQQRQTTQAQTQYQNNQEPIVTKHFYVHAAPEDPEEDAGPRLVQIGLYFFLFIFDFLFPFFLYLFFWFSSRILNQDLFTNFFVFFFLKSNSFRSPT